jgi:glycosyltransferase involved in cell wall biosynthesis
MQKISIIIPTKNEEESLSILLKDIKNYEKFIGEIIIIDGKSTDKTTDIAKQFNCKIIIQKEETGYGNAIIEGINNSCFEYSLIMDGDGSKNPLYIPHLHRKILEEKLDIVFAERYGPNSGSLDDTLLTYLGNRIFTNLGKIFFKIQINDILHTFFICKNSSFKKLLFKNFDFGFCVELPIKTHKYKLNYKSIPSIERKRIAGRPKVRSFIDGIKILKSMLILFIASLRENF